MAVTNKQIMMEFRMEHGISESEPLYTFAVWKKMGYKIKKGEHAKYEVEMWKYNEKIKTVDDKEIKTGYCFGKVMHLFTKEQVEPIKK